MKVAVVYNEPVTGKPDSEDVLSEVGLVIDAVKSMGHDFKTFSIYSKSLSYKLSEEIYSLLGQLRKYSPSVIFNLVESIGENQRLYPIMASLIEISGYPYTGSPFEALYITTDKTLTKAVLTAYGIPTPLWVQYKKDNGHISQISGVKKNVTYAPFKDDGLMVDVPPPWIIKPAREDASVGVDYNSVFSNKEFLIPKFTKMYSKYNGQPILIEEYIDGREFNVSLFERSDGTVEVLPVAEMTFKNWPEEKPRIVSYKAKWDKSSFEYNNSVRKFKPKNAPLDSIKSLVLKCWSVLGLRGYARVDMRMNKKGEIFVIEVNTNPCISPDSGFIMAIREAGYDTRNFVEEMLKVAPKMAVK